MEITPAHEQNAFRSLRAERDSFFPSSSGPVVEIAGRGVGEDRPVFVIAEIWHQPQWFASNLREAD